MPSNRRVWDRVWIGEQEFSHSVGRTTMKRTIADLLSGLLGIGVSVVFIWFVAFYSSMSNEMVNAVLYSLSASSIRSCSSYILPNL